MDKIGLGGGCHWCTEAIFQSLRGVERVEQGFVASIGDNERFSEAVIVHFDSMHLSLHKLIEIHLLTHESTSNHYLRAKYRSAIYSFSEAQRFESQKILEKLRPNFEKLLITEVLPFKAFQASSVNFSNYYLKNPQKPFCKTYIWPKINLLLEQYPDSVDKSKMVAIDAIHK